MKLELEDVVRSQVCDYIEGRTSIGQLERSFAPLYWASAQAPEEAPSTLQDVQLLLAEFSSGDWSEEELREELCQALPSACVSFSFDSSPAQWASPSLSSDRQSVVECA